MQNFNSMFTKQNVQKLACLQQTISNKLDILFALNKLLYIEPQLAQFYQRECGLTCDLVMRSYAAIIEDMEDNFEKVFHKADRWDDR